jgi:hypothetical protein
MTHKHVLRFWLIVIAVFLLVFLYSFVSLKSGSGVIDIMPYQAEDWSMMALSIVGIFSSLFHIVRHKSI